MGKKLRMSDGKIRDRKKTVIVLLLLAVLLLSSGVVIFMSQTYTIKFNSRGGESLPNMTGSRKAADLPIPVRPGQTFLGWSKSTTPGGDAKYITSTRQLSSGVELYAHWEETNFVINFYSEGEQINQLGFNENDAFTNSMMTVVPFNSYWMLKPQSESGHSKFQGWAFKDINGKNAWLWYDNPDKVDAGVWTLEVEGATPRFTRLTQGNSFLPQLYDGTMHAVWEYKDLDIYALPRAGAYLSGNWVSDATYGKTISVGQNGSLSSAWYQGGDVLVGWKIGFLDDEFNMSPLKVGDVGSSKNIMLIDDTKETGKNSDLSSLQLQQINDLFDKVYPISEPFYVDPLLAYIVYQAGIAEYRTHKLFIYPVTSTGGSLYYDARFNLVTESGTIIKRVGDGTKIQFGLPRERELETFIEYYFDEYNLSGSQPVKNLNPTVVTRSAIESAISQGQDGAIVATTSMHPEFATIFYEKWEKKDVRISFDYGKAGTQNKNGFFDSGVRKIHSINFEDNDLIKSRYQNATVIESSIAGAGDIITLPSASMFARANMNFIGWQEEVLAGMQPGRIYPAGYEYTVSSDFGLSYKMNAVWSDSQINFSFNLAGGRGFSPADLNKMRGSEGDTATIPTEKPTRFGYNFVHWISDRTAGTFAPGATIGVKRDKQILTAVWSKKQVTMTMNFAFSDINYNEISGSMVLTSLFDQTVRLQAINPDSTLTNVTIKESGQASTRPATAQEIAEIKATAADNGRFNLLYKLVGWTFRNPNNKLDPRAMTFGATQTINLNEKIVREDANGALRADAFQEDEKNTVELAVYGEYGDSNPVKRLSPLINSFPRLAKNDYSSYVRDVMKMNTTHEFVGFFALPQWVTALSSFDMSHYWDNTNGEYMLGSSPWVTNLGESAKGQLLRFYGTTEGGIAGRDTEGVAQNFRISEPMNFYLWLKPKAVTIDYYGIVNNGNDTWKYTDTPDYHLQSYFGDSRSAYQDLGSSNAVNGKSNLERIPVDPDFFFLNWTVEYYYTDTLGESVLFNTETIDLMLNAAGQPGASYTNRLLQTGLTKLNGAVIEAPVSRIVIKPNMQSVNEFVVRVIDATGIITGTPGTSFNVVLQKTNPVRDGNYVVGQIKLEQALILGAKIQRLDPIWGQARWPRAIYGAPAYGTTYWSGSIYVGPASSANPYVTLGDLLDDKSKKITSFYDNVNALGEGTGNTYVLGQTYGLHAAPNDNVTASAPPVSGHIDVRSGAVSLYPEFAEITYTIQIMNDTTVVHTITTDINGNSIKVDNAAVLLDKPATPIKNSNVSQPGFYFDERINNLSTVNYLAEGKDIPRNQRTGDFKLGSEYQVGKLPKIPPPTSVEFDFAPKTIKLYIVWLQSNVTLRYENNIGDVTPGTQRVFTESSSGSVQYMVGSTVSLFGSQSGWYRHGYTLAGWSVTENASAKDFNLGNLSVLLSCETTNGASGILNVTQSSPDTSTYPHRLTVIIYPYWQATNAQSVTFDFSPEAVDTNPQIELMTGNRWYSSVTPGQTSYSITGPFPYNRNIGNIESNWMMFKYKATGEQDDFRMFGGWYYTDVFGIEHDLQIVNGQLLLNEIFLAAPVGNQRSIVQHIVIKARWVSDASQFFQFDIANEAIKNEYTVKKVANGSETVYVSVRDGFSGDAEFIGQIDANNVPYVLAYNKYIGPAGKGVNGGLTGDYQLSTHPQFFRTEVTVEVKGDDGQLQTVVKALNPMYEKLSGQPGDSAAPGVRTVISSGSTLVRWETRRIPNWSASPMDSTHPFLASMDTRLLHYNTGNSLLANYAKFDGREGNPVTAPGAGFQISNIYQTFVQGVPNTINLATTNNSRYERLGYELVGFAISDEFNKGVAFGADPDSRLNAPNTYTNNYLFKPRPDRIMLVPIYMPRDVTLTFKKQFGTDTELEQYTDVKHGNYQIVSQNSTEIVVKAPFDGFIDLPFLETRGSSKNPLLDKQEWLMGWRYFSGSTNTYAVYGDCPDELLGNLLDTALGFQVKHDPNMGGGNLVFESVWGSSTRMEINYHVLMPEPGKYMSEWQTKPLYFNKTKVNEIAGDNTAYDKYEAAFSGANRFLGSAVMGSVAEHYRKPVMENGSYDYSQASYAIPKDASGVLDSAFTLEFIKTGLRPLGWFMEDKNTGRPLIVNDPETGYPCVARTKNAIGNYEYDYAYSGGVVNRVWQRDGSDWNIVNLSPSRGGATQAVNVYLVYDYVEGSVVFNGGGNNDVIGSYDRTVFGKYSYNITLPGADKISRPGKDFYGWTEEIALKRMRNYYQTLAEANTTAEIAKRASWENNDFVKVENGPDGSPAIYRYVKPEVGIGNLELITVYKTSYKYLNPTHGAIVNMYAVWEERIIVHTFRDGTEPGTSIRIWGTADGASHNAAYGLEGGSVSLQNGITSDAKYFYSNNYGEDINSKLPIPTKEGYKFLYWVDVGGLGLLGTNIGQAGATPPSYAYRDTNQPLTKCDFQNSSVAVLYAVWAPYYYAVEFDTNNEVAGEPTDTWTSVVADINAANSGPTVTIGGTTRTVTLFSSGTLTIPEYKPADFKWSDPAKADNVKFLGWTPVKNDSTFTIDTKLDSNKVNSKTLSFAKVNDKNTGVSDYSVKVGILNNRVTSDWLTYNTPDYVLYGDKYVRTVKLYALWEFGEIAVKYYDDDTGTINDNNDSAVIHAQDAYLLNSARTAIGADYRLVVPSLDNDYMQYGVMVADETVIPATRLSDQEDAKKSFGGWRMMRGPADQVAAGKIYYPGDFLDGTIRENIALEAVWYDRHSTSWSTLRTSGTVSTSGTVGGTPFTESNSKILVLPTPTPTGADNWNSAALEITNPNIQTIIFPRMSNGTIAADSIIAHGVSRIVLPSVDRLTVATQAIHSEKLQKLYLGDQLVVAGNPVAGKASIDQSSGAITVSSAMTAYLVQQGAQKFIPDTGSGAEMKFAVAGTPDNPSDPNYIRGGNKNKQSANFAYITNRNYFGALYSTNKATLFAYPGAAASMSLDTSVRTIKSYALAYMAGINSTSDLFAVATNAATTMEPYAIFHSNAQTIRLPSAAGSSIAANAVFGYQPNLRSVYFGTTGTTASSNFAHVDGNILYHGASGTTGTLRTNVMYVLRHAVVGNSFTIPARVTSINDYALSSFYIGTSGGNVTNLTVDASVALDIKHFRNPSEKATSGEARGQHTFYLTAMTLNGVSSVDHRVFRGSNVLTRLNLNSAGIDLVSENYTLGQNEFPIFVPTETMLNAYLLSQMEKWGALKYSSGNFRLQTLAKTVSYAAGSATVPDVGQVAGSGSAPTAPLTVNYGGSFTIPQNTFTAPLSTSFIGWRIASDNSAINGKIYQPGWTFNVGSLNSQSALNSGEYVAGASIYIQSSIKLTAEWEVKKFQFIDKNGVMIDNQTVLLRKDGTSDALRAATNMELAGKKVGINGAIENDPNTYNFFLVGANLTPILQSGDSYSFVGWIERANANSHPDWQWGNNNNNSLNKLIPDGVAVGTINLKIASPASIKYFHALYDVSSGNNVTYTASGATNASARVASRTGTGNIAIPAAVIDTSVGNVATPQGFMKRVTIIETGGFQNMTNASRTKVYIGGLIQQINSYAFMKSTNITTVEFGHNYVSGMAGLAIESYAFGDMYVSSFKLPLATTSIGSYAFSDNRFLTSVTFDVSRGGALTDARLTTIGAYAFWSDSSLTQMFEIPKNVTSIGPRAFVATKIPEFTSANTSADGKYFVIDGNLCYRVTASNVHLVAYAPGKTATSVASSVFTGIHRIVSGAFAENYVITAITIPATVTYIEAGAFDYSIGIQTITLGHSVPTAIHGGNTPAYNPFSNITAVIRVNANAAQLTQWKSVSHYYPLLFVTTQP